MTRGNIFPNSSGPFYLKNVSREDLDGSQFERTSPWCSAADPRGGLTRCQLLKRSVQSPTSALRRTIDQTSSKNRPTCRRAAFGFFLAADVPPFVELRKILTPISWRKQKRDAGKAAWYAGIAFVRTTQQTIRSPNVTIRRIVRFPGPRQPTTNLRKLLSDREPAFRPSMTATQPHFPSARR